MRLSPPWLGLLCSALPLVIGCTGPDPDATPPAPETSFTTEPPEIVDTGWPAGDLGSFMLVTHATGGTKVYGVFTESSDGFINLAECAIEGTPCLTALPDDEDDWKEIDEDRELDREVVNTRFLGWEIQFGPYTMPYREDPETGFGYYVADVTNEPLVEGWIGPTWEGQWNPYSSTDDLFVSRPIELISPPHGGHISFHNGEFVPFEWVPNGEGFVTMSVTARFGIQRMYLLEDDGYYELDADSLGFKDDLEDLTVKFTRWNTEQLQKGGHVVDLVATTDAFFTADYFNIGSRDYLYASDLCGEAQGLPALQEGGWWGSMGPWQNNLSPSANDCLGLGSAGGREGFYRVEIDPKYLLTVDYNVYEESASVYLVTDCTNTNTCVTGSDLEPDDNVHEYINFFNDTDDVRRLYLGVDATADASSIYTLDVTLDPLFPPETSNTCAEAEASAQVFPGSYYGEFVAYTDDVNLGAGGCTLTSTPGNDMMMPVVIPAGQTLSANVNMENADPAMMILLNCSQTCAVGADLSLGTREQISYTNQSNNDETVYLTIDTKDGIQPYFLGVNIY